MRVQSVNSNQQQHNKQQNFKASFNFSFLKWNQIAGGKQLLHSGLWEKGDELVNKFAIRVPGDKKYTLEAVDYNDDVEEMTFALRKETLNAVITRVYDWNSLESNVDNLVTIFNDLRANFRDELKVARLKEKLEKKLNALKSRKSNFSCEILTDNEV